METMQVQGAYGRDYATRKAALEDWNAGKDFFVLAISRYASKRDAEANGITHVEVYRRDGRLLTVIKV